jgi:hypothetical protein
MMKGLFAAASVVACVVGSTPGFVRGGFAHGAGLAHGAGHGGFVHDPTTLLGNPAPQMPTFEYRSPAPLARPSQAPIVNGPPARSPYGGVMH